MLERLGGTGPRRLRTLRISLEVGVLGLSIWKIAMIGGVVILMFGRGKVSELMGDVAKGIKSFKRGMIEEDEPLVLDQKPVARPVEEPARV
jgi:sec-independent protein translocase protein TatA